MSQHSVQPSRASATSGASPRLYLLILGGFVLAGFLGFLMYYGWLHTPGKPLDMMR